MTEKRKTRQRIMHPCPIRNSLKMPQTWEVFEWCGSLKAWPRHLGTKPTKDE
jgi:hypothetical protein